MSNVCDYILWRGDLELNQSQFNEIDSLILTRFSYFPFDTLIEKDEIVTIKELAERFKQKDISKMPILWKDDVKLFPLMGQSKRFGKMLATKYINKINLEQEKQFSAITIIMPDDTIYISFRGTDNTIVGWKEDFNMSFKSHVASQKDAVNYLEKIANEYPNKKIRIGGHSKGGNLAVYSAVFCNKDINDRIISIDNNDGPGFSDDITNTFEYKEIIKKVHTYIPQSSIIGRLLNHEEEYTILESIQKGIMQHDLYSWQLEGTKFKYVKELTNGSEIVDKTIKGWLTQIDAEKREKVIDTLFDILYKTDADTMKKFKANWFANVKTVMKSYKNLDEESKKMIIQVISSLINIGRSNLIAKK